MRSLARSVALCVVSGAVVFLAACGGGGGGGTTTPPPVLTTPTVKVTPASNSITIAQSLQVTVAVTGSGATPTGTVTLTSGSYASSPTALTAGSATITIPASTLAAGSASLSASYNPDSSSSSTYKSASGTAMVSVTVATPTVTVTPVPTSIGTGQPLSVTVTVAGFAGGATPTGSVTLTTTGYTSAATALSGGSVTIIILPNTLAAGSYKLTASYSPDPAGSALYASASNSANITVTSQTTPTVTVTPASQSLATSSSLSVTVKVSGSGATPSGSVVLSSGSYTSAAATLTSGSATITVAAYSLVSGSDTLSATYTPDAQSATTYNSSTGTSAPVSVAKATPTVTVTPASQNISPLDSLSVTVAVNGGSSGTPVGTGTVSLSGGGYTSPSPVTISGASTTITIPAGALASGSDTLSATYTPDTASSTWYKTATGTSAAITVSSLVSVAQGTSVAPVTDQLMGMNLAAWYDVVGNASSINPAFVAAGIKAIRWPGGSWSDAFHWGDGGTAQSRCINPKSPGDTTWPGVGTFATFMSAIPLSGKYDLALTANYGSNVACNAGGDPQEAADWAAEAVKEGLAVSHMTVGNEEYGTSWELDFHTKPNDPTTYATEVTRTGGYYDLIKTASPTTLVGVDVDAGSTQPGWDTTVLSLARGSYDFVEYHFYPQAPGNESDTYLVHQAAQDLTNNINILKSELTASGAQNTPIYVGEMGSVFSAPGKQSWSITQGLYAGQTLGEMMNAGVVRATWWIGFGNCDESSTGTALGNMSSSLYGWQTFGAYNVFSDGPSDGPCGVGSGAIGTMSPTARAFELFSNLAVANESVLSASVTGDLTNIRGYAATHSGGTALFLFNLNETTSEPVTVTLSKQIASNDVTVITYDKSIYDQTNPAVNPTPVWAPPTTTDMGAQNLPLTLTLTPWSMNVVIIK